MRDGYNGGMNHCEVVAECGDGISLVWMDVCESCMVSLDEYSTQLSIYV